MQAGQSTLEYVLLLVVVISLVVLVMPGLGPLITKVQREFNDRYKAAYRYGDPRTKGYDNDEGLKFHARGQTLGAGGGTGNFRLHRRNE